jgi:hypothetical protein
VVAEDDADPPPSQEPRQPLLAVAQWHAPRRWSASKIATPSGPQTTASPSRVNDVARSCIAVTTMAGYRPLQS